MTALILGAFWALSKTKIPDKSNPSSNDLVRQLAYSALGITLLWLAILIKFVPLLLAPFFFLYLLAREKTWRQRLELGFFLFTITLLVTVAYYAYFWQWPEVSHTFTRRGAMFRLSIPSTILIQLKQNMNRLPFLREWGDRVVEIRNTLHQILGDKYINLETPLGPLEVAQAIAGWPFLITFFFAYLIILLRAVRVFFKPTGKRVPGFRGKVRRLILGTSAEEKSPWQTLISASLNSFLLYLILANFWFWPWYMIWPIGLFALAKNKRLMVPLVLASCAGELYHVGLNFVWYWWGVEWATLYRVEIITFICMYVPACLWYIIAPHVKTPSTVPQVPELADEVNRLNESSNDKSVPSVGMNDSDTF
jgi:hypothetical protein